MKGARLASASLENDLGFRGRTPGERSGQGQAPEVELLSIGLWESKGYGKYLPTSLLF